MTENRSAEPAEPVRPEAAGAAPVPGPGADALDELLLAAARPGPVAPGPAGRALAAFRAARDEGALRQPVRAPDDWRAPAPRRRLPPARALKAGAGALAAGVLLGGVAMAAGALPVPFAEPSPRVPSPAPRTLPAGPPSVRSDPAPSGRPSPPATPERGRERPPTAKGDLAHCRRYGAGREDTGWARDPAHPVHERLARAAGGPEEIAAYCARLLADAPASPPGREWPAKPARPAKRGKR